jgi:predicted ArsR family transcriptional regulator
MPPETSASAYHALSRERKQADHRRILAALEEHGGLTCDELVELLGLLHQTASARLNGMAAKGLAHQSAERRPTRTGRAAVVWQAGAQVTGQMGLFEGAG